MKPGDVVVIAAFDEVPEHWFEIEEVLDDCVTGTAITGPLAGEYRHKCTNGKGETDR